MLLLGYAFKRVIVDPLIRHGVIPLVIATLGLSIGVKQLVKAGVQRARRIRSRARFPTGQLALGGIKISYADIGTLLLAGADRRRPAAVPQPHGDRARDAGGGAEHRRRARCSASTSSAWCSTRS